MAEQQHQPARERKPLRILVVGAGIAGPAFVLSLSRFFGVFQELNIKMEITIIEHRDVVEGEGDKKGKRSWFRNAGQQIDIRGQGIEAMRLMGIEEKVRERRVDEPGVVFLDGRGVEGVRFGEKSGGSEQDGGRKGEKKGEKKGLSTEWEIMRGDLLSILYSATVDLPNVSYKFGTSISSLVSSPACASVVFSDGNKDEYDLVVGADGVGSQVRKLIFSDAKTMWYPVGQSLAFFTIPAQAGDRKEMTICNLPGRKSMVTRQDKEDCLRVFFSFAGKDEKLKEVLRGGSVEEQKREWARIFGGDNWQAVRFVEGMLQNGKEGETWDDFYTQELAQIRASTWADGGNKKVVLLGDAGYCPSPATGMGTTLALVGGWVLAGEIASAVVSRDGNVEEGIKRYEEQLRPLVKQIQGMPVGLVYKIIMPSSDMGIRALHFALRMGKMLRVGKMVGWVVDRVEARWGWKLPVYEDGRVDV
ncbi:kynurenine 3-monooxygenase [Podospora australis]|uniref:Kynurenine 3-monooxygenase n=1 Tax=Podospora australis TaxID=1536484 RepID=A0AAN6WSJ1_9PEZI|nr:kynurenine 3-monooxygenase [Podospora australis]